MSPSRVKEKFHVPRKQTVTFQCQTTCYICIKQDLTQSRVPDSWGKFFAPRSDPSDPWRVETCSRCRKAFCFKNVGGHTRIGLAYCSECKGEREQSIDIADLSRTGQTKDKLRASSHESFKRAKVSQLVSQPGSSGPLGLESSGGGAGSSSSNMNASEVTEWPRYSETPFVPPEPERPTKTHRRITFIAESDK